MNRMCYFAALLPVVGLLLGGSGCSYIEQKQREEQLQRVAKDWSMTIRASQVIPVYPMTEDLQPGDVFLVRSTVETQHRLYMHQGYLPLDYHLKRIDPTGYNPFYETSFFDGGERLPKTWLLPGEAASFRRAPGAAFPAYSFSVKNGAGFSAALPIQGVPVGLSLLGSAAGSGSVTIQDARTYGVDIVSLVADVQTWAAMPKTIELLKAYAPVAKSKPAYLRVVYRVYLTGKLGVSLASASSSAAGVDAGAKVRPVDLPLLAPSTQPDAVTSVSYAQGLKTLNDTLQPATQPPSTDPSTPAPTTTPSGGAPVVGAAAPTSPIGASLRLTAVSARSVSIDETFPRPVVIGYLGFDMAILADGKLGPPMPTYAVLQQAAVPAAVPVEQYFLPVSMTRVRVTYDYVKQLAETAPDASVRIRADGAIAAVDVAAAPLVPVVYPVTLWKVPSDSDQLTVQAAAGTQTHMPADLPSLLQFHGALRESLRVLRAAAGATQRAVPDPTGEIGRTEAELKRVEQALTNLQPQVRALDEVYWLN